MQKFHDPQGYRGRYPWDGSLDPPDSSLAKLDVVVAAVHSHFDLPRQAQTDRVIRALENRHVSILAHPTARLIGEPEPYDIDMDRVISTAHKAGCYLEINAGPDRLDLNDLHAHAAKFAGGEAGGLDGCALHRCIPVHALRHRSDAARLAHGKRCAEHPAARRIAASC